MKWIEQFSLNPILAGLASALTICSFIISIFVLFNTGKIKSKLNKYMNMRDFNEDRVYRKDRLVALRDLIVENKRFDQRIKSDINIEIRIYEDYLSILSIKDKYHIHIILNILKKDISEIDKNDLCHELSYFISKYDKDKRGLII